VVVLYYLAESFHLNKGVKELRDNGFIKKTIDDILFCMPDDEVKA
jgi:hypothetical protein